MAALRHEFWKRFPGLVWSNPDADDTVRIRAALLRPKFSRLLEIAIEFGVERLHREWAVLKSEDSSEVRRATGSVERILRNIEKGFSIAATGN